MQQKRFVLSDFLKIILLIIGISLFIWSLKITYEKQRIEASLDIENQLNDFVSRINDKLMTSTEVLYSLSNLVNTFNNLGPEEFGQFTSDLSSRKKGILLIEWQPRVLEIEREQFINKVRKMGLKSFDMLEPDENDILIKAKKRAEHFPVLYAVSTRRQETSIGLDLAWSPERMQSKYEARDLGVPRASNTFPVILIETEQNASLGFAITLPVYKTKSIPSTLEARKKQLKGFLAAVIYLEELFNPFVEILDSKNLQLQITDLASDTLMIKNVSVNNSKLTSQKEIDVFGQKWRVKVYATDKYLRRYFSQDHFFIPYVLLLFILGLFYVLYRNENKNKELSKARTDLQKALHNARVAAKSKMMFLANMSHEIRTPMNAILGYAKLIKGEEDDKLRQQYIDRMAHSGEHLLSVIDDILDVSSLEESKVKLHLHKFNLHELIAEVNDIVAIKFRSTGNEYIYSVDSSLHDLYGDSIRLRQILINLLSNAFKFTEKGKVFLSCVNKGVNENKQITVQFKVQDSGIGMDKDYLSRAYQPFSQEDETFSRKKGGTGLGLSIVYNLVKMMNGKINIDSRKGVGTTFIIDLPFEQVEQSSEKKSEDEEVSDKDINWSAKKSVLIAEDDEDARFLIKLFLKDLKLKLDFATNGRELIDMASKTSYDLILTDIQMPELDGLSATRKLRDQGVKTPIVALSAHALMEEKEKCMQAGISDILSKPVNQHELISFIKKYLGQLS